MKFHLGILVFLAGVVFLPHLILAPFPDSPSDPGSGFSSLGEEARWLQQLGNPTAGQYQRFQQIKGLSGDTDFRQSERVRIPRGIRVLIYLFLPVFLILLAGAAVGKRQHDLIHHS